MSAQLPAKSSITSVDVTKDDVKVTISDEEASAALKAAGLIKVAAVTVQDLKKIGIYAEGLGVLQTEGGRAFVSLSRLERFLAKILEKVENEDGEEDLGTKDLVALGRVFGLLSGKLTEAQKLMLEMHGVRLSNGSPQREAPPATPSFPPSVAVQVNVQGGDVKVQEKG